MSSISAVRTTGIYCVPECSARPHPRNVELFATAAAAEAAGYRACLRCRPYRHEQALGAIGPELVCRAVQMVLDGALDEGRTEHDLGARLGVSARHLRRLFAEHLGASPDQLARSRRAHFARRLLDDTDLTIAEVAFASGFGSVRQLGRACTDVFGAAPTALRARRRASDRLAADGGLTLRLPFAGPLEWQEMLDYLAARAIPGVESVSGGTYRRTVRIDGDPGVIELSRDTTGRSLVLRVHLPHWEGLIHHAARARRIFGLDADVATAHAKLAGDPIAGPLVRAHPGLRAAGTWDPFEIGVRAIVGQQVSVKAANRAIGLLVASCGSPVPDLTAIRLTHVFPTPQALAAADLDDVGLTSARASAVRAFARAVAGGTLDLDPGTPLEDFVAAVVEVPGLGPWTAQYVALRTGHADAFPAGDLGLRRALERATGGAVSAKEAERVAEPWRPYRALVAAQLWRSGAPAQLGERSRASRTDDEGLALAS